MEKNLLTDIGFSLSRADRFSMLLLLLSLLACLFLSDALLLAFPCSPLVVVWRMAAPTPTPTARTAPPTTDGGTEDRGPAWRREPKTPAKSASAAMAATTFRSCFSLIKSLNFFLD